MTAPTPFGTFPNIHPFWYHHPSLVNIILQTFISISYIIHSRNLYCNILIQGLPFFMTNAYRRMGFSKYWTHLSLHKLWSKMKKDQLKNCRKSICWLGYGLLLLIIHTSQHDLRDNTDKERKTKHYQLDPAHSGRKWKWRHWRKKRRSCGNRCLCNDTAGHVGPSGRLSH